MSYLYDRMKEVRFSPQGEHENALPHRLIALFDPGRHMGIQWKLECPYEGAERPCALLWECEEHERPKDPYHQPMVSFPGLEVDPEYAQELEAYEKAMEEWEEEHPQGPYHPVDRCWAEHMLADGDLEPEYFLEGITEGTPVISPVKVSLGQFGHGEEGEPVFRLWIDENNEERP